MFVVGDVGGLHKKAELRRSRLSLRYVIVVQFGGQDRLSRRTWRYFKPCTHSVVHQSNVKGGRCSAQPDAEGKVQCKSVHEIHPSIQCTEPASIYIHTYIHKTHTAVEHQSRLHPSSTVHFGGLSVWIQTIRYEGVQGKSEASDSGRASPDRLSTRRRSPIGMYVHTCSTSCEGLNMLISDLDISDLDISIRSTSTALFILFSSLHVSRRITHPVPQESRDRSFSQ